MLTMKETEAAYARFLSETNCKRLPKNADALFTQLEKQLRTIDEAETDGYFPAIAAALFQLGLDRDDVSVEIVERAKSGFLGIGASPAVIRVQYEVADEAPAVEEAPKAPLICAKTIDRP